MSENRSRFVVLCQQALACAVVVAVAAPATGVAQLDIVAPHQGSHPSVPAGSLVAAEPVAPRVTEVPITAATSDRGAEPGTHPGVASAESTEAVFRTAGLRRQPQGLTRRPAPQPVADGGERIVTQPERVGGFATVGITWDKGTALAEDEIAVKVRTQQDGDWSGWQDVEYHADHGPDPGSAEARHQRFGTDPVVIGDVDDVQVKAVTTDSDLPDDMRLSIVDPGESEEVQQQPAIDTAQLASAETTPSASATTPASPAPSPTPPPAAPTVPADPGDDAELIGNPADVTPKPKIFSRAQWGADERMRDKGSLHYFEVHAGFVHHTVNANGYSRAQVPSIIRGIYAYHTQSRGWSDIGYNFLVDRFGRIWEGRYGGVDRPVVGAHTLGYNDAAFAMSAIGNYETAHPNKKLLNAYGRLFAWKLSLHGIDAGSMRQQVAGRTLPAINGHRDVGQTACPGRYLYAKIGVIRAKAEHRQHPFTSRGKDTDLSGSRWPDVVVRDKSSHRAFVVRTGGQVGFSPRHRAASGWQKVDMVAATRDLDGDKIPDVLARDGRTKVTGFYPGDGSGDFRAATKTTHRFKNLDLMIGVGDMDEDGDNDMVGRVADSGRLYLFPGRGNGQFHKSRLLSPSWGGYETTAGVGDFDGDGHTDLVARDHDNVLWLVRGNGRGSLGAKTALPRKWGRFDILAGMGDLTNDGKPDIVARIKKKQLTFIYPGDGHGGIGQRYGGFTRFKNLDFLVNAGDVSGSGGNDLIGRNNSGHLVMTVNSGGQGVARVVSTGNRFGRINLILNVGDWDGDGHGDVITRNARNGNLQLRRGTSGNGFKGPQRAGTGWGKVDLVAAVGDITGDGYPDLMGQPRGHAMRIYPGNGNGGFRHSYVAHSRIASTEQVGMGLWNRDGSPDSLLRRSDGRLLRYPGNGPGGLEGGHTVGSASNRYDWMIGAGDLDGDRNPDVLARDGKGRLWILPGKKSGFAKRRFVAEGFGKYDLAG